MFKKLFFVLFAAIAFQASCEAKPYNDDIARGLIETIEQILDKLLEIFENAVQTAINGFKELIQMLKDYAVAVIKEAFDNIVALVEDIIGQLNDLKEIALNLGVDIKECVEEQEQIIINMPNVLLDDMIKCATDQIDEAEKIVSDTIAEINGVIVVITTLEERFKACGTGIFAIPCLTEVLKDATTAVVELPSKIVEQYEKAKEMILTIPADLEYCATSNLENAIGKVTGIFDNMKVCIEDKIEAHVGLTNKHILIV